MLSLVSYHSHSFIHVTVTEDDEWRLPAQLQRNLLQVADCTAAKKVVTKTVIIKHEIVMCEPIRKDVCHAVPLHDLFADWCGASEAQLANVWVVGQTLSHHATCRGERDLLGDLSIRMILGKGLLVFTEAATL